MSYDPLADAFGHGPLAADPDLSPVWFEQIDGGGAVIATGMVSRVIYDQAVARGLVTLREVAAPAGTLGAPPLN